MDAINVAMAAPFTPRAGNSIHCQKIDKKDIIKFFDIFLSEITKALSNGERVELRDTVMFESRVQKQRISLNPRTLEKIEIPEKKSILFKCSKEWKKKLNEKK